MEGLEVNKGIGERGGELQNRIKKGIWRKIIHTKDL